MRLMPAGTEIRLRTTGTQRQKKTVMRPLLRNQSSAFAISSPFRRRSFPTFPSTRRVSRSRFNELSKIRQKAESPLREWAGIHFPGKSEKRARDTRTAPSQTESGFSKSRLLRLSLLFLSYAAVFSFIPVIPDYFGRIFPI